MPARNRGISFSASVIDGVAFGTAKSLGSRYSTAGEDHSHGTPSAATSITNCTSAIAAATGGSGSTVARGDHFHRASGALVTATTLSICTSSTATWNAIKYNLPANYLVAGTTFGVHIFGSVGETTTGYTYTYALHMGPSSATSAANNLCSLVLTATSSVKPFELRGLVTMSTATSALGRLWAEKMTGTLGTPYQMEATATTAAIDVSSAANTKYIQLTCTCNTSNANAFCNIYNGIIEVIKL